VELAISAIAITHSFMIISQARKGQRLRIQRSGHCIGCSPKARLRASPQALEAVYEQERQSFLTVAIRQDAFGSGFQLSPTAWLGWSDSNCGIRWDRSPPVLPGNFSRFDRNGAAETVRVRAAALPNVQLRQGFPPDRADGWHVGRLEQPPHTLSAILSARALMETMAVMSALAERVADALAAEDLGALDQADVAASNDDSDVRCLFTVPSW
jgi:hypothetical protein